MIKSWVGDQRPDTANPVKDLGRLEIAAVEVGRNVRQGDEQQDRTASEVGRE